MNKSAFLDALREELDRTVTAAPTHPAKTQPGRSPTDRFIANVAAAMGPDGSPVAITIDQPAFAAAWAAIGGEGMPTLDELRALPE
jgi:hypothetical protein